MCLAKMHLLNLNDRLTKIENDYAMLKSMQQEMDKKLSAMYHEIETGKFSSVAGYRKLKELQSLLRKRRVVKHELSKMQQLYFRIHPNKVKEKLHKLSGNIEKSDNRDKDYCEGWDIEIEQLLVK